jgi:hypothetical protein
MSGAMVHNPREPHGAAGYLIGEMGVAPEPGTETWRQLNGDADNRDPR